MEFILSMVIILVFVSIGFLATYVVRMIQGRYLNAGLNLGLFLVATADAVRILTVHGFLTAPVIEGVVFDRLLWIVGLAGSIIFAFCVVTLYVVNTSVYGWQGAALKSMGATFRQRRDFNERSKACRQTFNNMSAQMSVSSSGESHIAHDNK